MAADLEQSLAVLERWARTQNGDSRSWLVEAVQDRIDFGNRFDVVSRTLGKGERDPRLTTLLLDTVDHLEARELARRQAILDLGPPRDVIQAVDVLVSAWQALRLELQDLADLLSKPGVSPFALRRQTQAQQRLVQFCLDLQDGLSRPAARSIPDPPVSDHPVSDRPVSDPFVPEPLPCDLDSTCTQPPQEGHP